jgi:hypothetical protein
VLGILIDHRLIDAVGHRGLARMLMGKLEEEAKSHGQTLLVGPTSTGPDTSSDSI